ncbi:M3 family oligoendopeptidase [Helicovermis profundi]|uniref:M3 family oligoendopeptidase n=1 Tax=Helicovermis profundi TaxID=3065157 RepID=A0AAU9EA90_9FIRM|nr:M3 family oligoendopeptidase [Clostridia bacterium S502]
MNKFNDFIYEKLDMESIKVEFEKLVDKFTNSSTFTEQSNVFEKINDQRNHIETMMTLVSIRHSIDTTDEFYDKENDFMDEFGPEIEEMQNKFYSALVESKFRKELEEKWGKHLFSIADMQLKVFDSSIIEDLKNENKLVSEYMKLLASAKILFDGEERNLSQMTPYAQSVERNIRKDAHACVSKFFLENESDFDRIFDKLVKTRNEIAIKLGYKNYVELGYLKLLRSDYDAEMVKNYRKQVYENIVPLSNELRKRQEKRLKVDKLMHYDINLNFLSGNATPKGSPEWIIDNGKKMYTEMSEETDEFFNFMNDHKLMDLETKKGKANGGYCTFVSDYKAPFIFSNFNGTSGDVDVLTHEAGHAFQVYSSRNYEIPEYIWPTLEACEIHSMSMEFFAWPWMNLFFEEDTEKYKFDHLTGALLFIPYGVTVDEFQHWVYENPNVTPKERKEKWREIEKKYLPYKDYSSDEFLENGGFWFRQGHIFANPFYYIDYTLAQISAFEFWNKSNIDREKAWSDYLKLCKLGGSKSYLELVKEANLVNPFIDGSIAKIIKPIEQWIENIDDSKF